MPPRAQLVVLLVSMTAPMAATSVYAADAYLCGPDNIVYVEIENLEAMKRTDPCIAAYYGLTVAPKPVAMPETRSFPPNPAPAAAAPLPLLGLRPRLVSDELVSLPRGRSKQSKKTAAASPVVAAQGTDYRNVRVINAHAPAEEWFRHLK